MAKPATLDGYRDLYTEQSGERQFDEHAAGVIARQDVHGGDMPRLAVFHVSDR